MKQSFFAHFRFYPKPVTSLSFFILLALNGLLFSGRKTASVQLEILLRFQPDFYTHVSNFCISYILLSGIGYMWLLFGAGLHLVWYAALALAAANFIYELWLPLLNTTDIADAWFGFAGTVFAAGYLSFVAVCGLSPAPSVE